MSNSSYTVEAVLKANDSGFSNAFKNAQKSVSGLSSMAAKTGSMFKSVLGANLVSSALTSGISAISGGIRSMGTELNSSQKAWKTFEGNLQAFGRSSEQIAAAKSEMQDFATKTIYSASDMASTYSQLDAVGTKNVGSLVKAFGGLAASAENPAQAMKSISMQATQMASKPKIAWMDFKIMMEQAPAGMAAVAKEMGMSTDELVAAVQDGKVNTEEFFDAMNRAGNSEAFQKMATEFKTVDQAIDGAKETLSNKLMPAFEKLNQFGIKAVVALTDALDNIDFGKIADNLGKVLDGIDIEGIMAKAEQAMKMFFNPIFVMKFKSALDSVKGALSSIAGAFNSVAGGGWSWLMTASNYVSALIVTVRTGARAVKKFMDSFAETGAMQQIKWAIDSVIAAYSYLVSEVGEASIWSTLGTVIGNVAKVIAQVVQAIADFISRLDPSIVQGFTNVLVGGIAGLLAFSAGTKLVSTGIKGLDFIKSFNPFKLFKKNAEDSLDGTTNSVSRSKSTIAQLFSGLTNLIKGVGTSFKSIFDGIGKTLTGLGKTLTGLGKTFEGFGKGVGAVLKGLMQGLKGLNPATLLSFGAAIGIAAVGIGSGIGIIVAALSLLAEHSAGVSVIIQALGTAFATVAAAIIGAFAQAIVTVSGVLPVVTSALANLAPLVVAVGVAIGSTAPAITALGDAISAVVASVGVALPPIIAAISNAITQIGLMLGTILPPIITSLGTAISQVATAITPIVGIISGAFVQIVTVVSNAIVQIIQALSPFIPAITEMVVAVAPVLSQIVDAFNNLISQISPIIDSIANLFKTLGEQISNILDSTSGVITSFGDSVRNVLDGVAGIFDSMGNAALNAGNGVKQMAQGIATLTGLPLGDMAATLAAVASGLAAIVASGIGFAGAGLQAAGTGLMLIANAGMQAQVALTTLPSVITSFTTSLTGIGGALTTAGTAITNFAVGAVSSLAGLSGASAQIASFTAMVVTIVGAVGIANAGLASFNGQANAAGAALSVLGGRATAASSQIIALGTGIMSAMANATTAIASAGTQMTVTMQSAMNQVVNVVRNGMTNATAAVQNGASQMAAAMRSAGTQMVAAANSMVNQTVSAVRNGRGAMQSAGSYMAQGLAVGMRSALAEVTAAANQLVAQAEKAAQAKAKIHSPSRLFRDEVGWWIGAGISVGIDKSAAMVAKSVDFIKDLASPLDGDILTAGDFALSDMQESLSTTISVSHTPQSVQHNINNTSNQQRLIDKIDELLEETRRGRVIYMDGKEVGRTVDRHLGQSTQLRSRTSWV